MSGPRNFLADAPPPPAADADWPTILHWICRALETDHPDLSFASSLLSQAIERGLTDRQVKYADRMFRRLVDEWTAAQPRQERAA